MAETRRWLISGRVQGVFFRESTRREAEPLGLSGHAINLPDGRVEVVAHGEPDALEQLEKWLKSGPQMASVDQVKRGEVNAEPTVAEGFRTG